MHSPTTGLTPQASVSGSAETFTSQSSPAPVSCVDIQTTKSPRNSVNDSVQESGQAKYAVSPNFAGHPPFSYGVIPTTTIISGSSQETLSAPVMNSAGSDASIQPAVPGQSPETGPSFSYNIVTDSTAGSSNGQQLQSNSPDKVTAQSTPVSWEKLAGTDWSLVTTDDGKKYYYNAKTKASSWQIPVEVTDMIKKEKQEEDRLKDNTMSVHNASTYPEKGSISNSFSTPAVSTGGRDAAALRPSIDPRFKNNEDEENEQLFEDVVEEAADEVMVVEEAAYEVMVVEEVVDEVMREWEDEVVGEWAQDGRTADFVGDDVMDLMVAEWQLARNGEVVMNDEVEEVVGCQVMFELRGANVLADVVGREVMATVLGDFPHVLEDAELGWEVEQLPTIDGLPRYNLNHSHHIPNK